MNSNRVEVVWAIHREGFVQVMQDAGKLNKNDSSLPKVHTPGLQFYLQLPHALLSQKA